MAPVRHSPTRFADHHVEHFTFDDHHRDQAMMPPFATGGTGLGCAMLFLNLMHCRPILAQHRADEKGP
jgi:hypothetical protein